MPPPSRPLPENIIPQILLRVQPDDPASLDRASAVCKAWRRILADPAFACRYRAVHHRMTAPVLAFFHNPRDHEAPRFVPTTSFRLPTSDRHMRHVWDCRHGRVLLCDYDLVSPTVGVVVWDRRWGILPSYYGNAAVVCTASGGCDYRSCGSNGGPFIVAFAGVERWEDYPQFRDAHVVFYSSETREMSLTVDMKLDDHGKFHLEDDRPAVLVGDSLYFVRTSGMLLRYWFGPLLRLGYPGIREAGVRTSDILTLIEPPVKKGLGKAIVMTAEGGGLGLACLNLNRIALWARETDGDADVWVKRRTIDLKKLIPLTNPKRRAYLSGVIPGNADVIFVSTEDGVFKIALQPSLQLQATKVSGMGADVQDRLSICELLHRDIAGKADSKQQIASASGEEHVIFDDMASRKESTNISCCSDDVLKCFLFLLEISERDLFS